LAFNILRRSEISGSYFGHLQLRTELLMPSSPRLNSYLPPNFMFLSGTWDCSPVLMFLLGRQPFGKSTY